MWKGEKRKEEVPAPITLPPLDEQLQDELLWSRLIVVTHNHHRSDFALLLEDVEQHFQGLE